MNNWLYAGVVPADPWRSAMTLPRELELVKIDGKYILASRVVREIENIASEWETITDGSLGQNDAYQIRLTVDMTKENTWRLSNGKNDYLEFYVNPGARMIVAKRNGSTGLSSFSASFSLPALRMPVEGKEDVIELDIYVDRSSEEFFTADGTSAMTMIVFPEEIYDSIESTSGEINGKVRSLARIWK
jgi:fructan beta-fructosidase